MTERSYTLSGRPAFEVEVFAVSDDEIGNDLRWTDVNNDVDEPPPEYEVQPPSISTAGARRVMQRLCKVQESVSEEEYLKQHGARRALGNELSRENSTTAQMALRHGAIETTEAAYSDRGGRGERRDRRSREGGRVHNLI